MAVSIENSVWDCVIQITKVAQEKGSDPLLWALQLPSNLSSNGILLPSPELAEVLVSYICWDNNVPILWKFLEKALVLKILPPLMVLALLSDRVIPCWRSQPAAYRLFMELLKRHAFSLKSQTNAPHYLKVMKSIDAVLHLSQNFGLQASDPGILMVEFIYSIVWLLLDASLDDEGLLELTREEVRMGNKTSRNGNRWPTHWVRFIQRLRLLGANSSALRNSKTLTSEDLLQLTSENHLVLTQESKTSSLQKFHAVMGLGSLVSSAGLCHGASRSAFWLPLDLALEDAMDGYQVNATSAIEIITGLTKTLQAINSTTWHDTFLGLWIAALRLVQRVRICYVLT
ncbi:hypothetical protein GH714_002935 [Hevea brasiliensis]|uniref:Mediator of RNA polymerase II transcription subunit 33A n=1 Tax=Hevea brasiliensis TaxID=3981 RepID=A0A6A6KG13_HEVBR|nr:hypothetical protein GH714_002935 [Hevea brasiliensis]